MMLTPVFSLKLNYKIFPGQVCVGKFDGRRPCLACATTGGKVFIHSPHSRSIEVSSHGDVSLLNFNHSIKCLTCASLSDDGREYLFIGTPNSLLVYDVMNNSDVFYKELQDGANAIVIGYLGRISKKMVIVGGNCSIQGYDAEGNEIFWTVTGDNVLSMCLIDFNGDGNNELVVGSEDFDIRVFREDEIIAEMTETDVITNLSVIGPHRFGYALSNGTVGVYEKQTRIWRIKSKNHAVSIHCFDLNGNGVNELICGWSNGKIDARNDQSGEVIFKDNFSDAVAGIVEADYQMNGNTIMICASITGEIRGFQSSIQKSQTCLMDMNADQELLRDLTQQKQNLVLELKNYEENHEAGQKERPSGLGHLDQKQMGIIPANTQLQTILMTSGPTQSYPHSHITLVIETTNETLIRAVIIFAEGIFKGESYVLHPKADKLSNCVEVPILPPKDNAVDLHIKAFVGIRNTEKYHVFELTRQLPKFSMFELVAEDLPTPVGFVRFQIHERISRVLIWINQNFLLAEQVEQEQLNLNFKALRSNSATLQIQMDKTGQFAFLTDDMELAGQLVQSMTSFLNISDMQSAADFPNDFEILRDILQKVDDYNDTRQKLSAEMADHSNVIKNYVVKAEDERLMENFKKMKKSYIQLYNLNRELIQSYRIRIDNQNELLNYLKLLNQYIQRAGRLRVGKYKTAVVNGCRQAIKQNDINTLFKIIKTGVA